MQVIGPSCNAFHHKMQEPRETHADSTADPAERETLTQERWDLPPLLVWHASVQRIRGKLAMARLTAIRLFAMASRAIFLASVRSTRGARISDEHGCW
jgi:hypothetical protein